MLRITSVSNISLFGELDFRILGIALSHWYWDSISRLMLIYYSFDKSISNWNIKCPIYVLIL